MGRRRSTKSHLASPFPLECVPTRAIPKEWERRSTCSAVALRKGTRSGALHGKRRFELTLASAEAVAVRRPLGLSDDLVDEEGEVVDGAGLDEAHGLLLAGLDEERMDLVVEASTRRTK